RPPGGATVAADVHRGAEPPLHPGDPRLRRRAHHEPHEIAAEAVGDAGPALASGDPAEDPSLEGPDQHGPSVWPQGGEGRRAGHVDRAALVPDRLRPARMRGHPGESLLTVRRLDGVPVDSRRRAMTAFDPPFQALALGAAIPVLLFAARRRQLSRT